MCGVAREAREFDVVVLLREGTVLSSSVMSKRSKATDYPLS